MYLTPFGERARKGRPRPQPKRRPRQGDVTKIQKTKKDETPNQLALGNLEKALKDYKVSPEAIRNYKSDAAKIDSIRYMNMETLAATLILQSRLNERRIGPDFFRQDMIDYVQPYIQYLGLSDEDFERESEALDPTLVGYLRVYRTISEEIKSMTENLVPIGAKYTPKEIENFKTKHSASILRYLRTLFRATLAEPTQEPEEEQ